MAAVPKKLKFLLFGRGAGFHARVAMVLEVLGLACLIVGIISGAMDRLLGLWSTEWFLITIALWILGLWSWLCAYTAAKER
jgi:hypothetical protein